MRLLRRLTSPHGLLIVVAVLYGCAALSQVPSLVAFNWDEVVYASQVRPGVPAVPMSAPRAWGMPLLLAPVAALTQSIPVIRCYLAVLAGVCLYAAFRPWLGLFGPVAAGPPEPGRDRLGERPAVVSAYAVPLAAGLLATLWSTVLYGAMAYPNLWLAFALVAAVGWFCRALREPGRTGPLAGVAVALAAASLLRPADAAAAALPLLVAGVVRAVRRAPRGPALLGAAAGGLAVGWTVWVAEAFARFGDPITRLRAGAEVNEARFGFILLRHLEAVDGPALLCRPPSVCSDLHWLEVSWWFTLPVLVAAAFVLAEAARPVLTLTLACAVTFALPYLTLFDYANPRFLQPAYALLAVCAGAALVRLPLSRLTRVPAIAALLAALAVHVYGQKSSLDRVVGRVEPIFAAQRAQADALLAQGVRPPCAIVGRGAIQLGYLTGCRSVRTGDDPRPGDEEVRRALATGERVVLVTRETAGRAPEGWTRLRLPGGRAYARQGANGSSN
ncbi:hypothetical protein GCM10010106_39330 [Thermopolyspora flexuosa]|uniref:4-amino-4-deoxy-L-arabinose transferase-like glycosyltransferase n=1 Tax=Thermopolyspora flexuosa TaxID=103836 RepID=A0A543J2C3_9ACTN|nr:hypothetical protein FHX40_3722 [Thermopolyspora flexuosa]GGM88227.1 hypothetical protein GCM10010106_39330 [Thermopolyspora flexuosa]